MAKPQFLVIVKADMGYSHITPFVTFKEAARHLEESKLEGEIFKGKTIAFSHKIEEWKVEKVSKIMVKEPTLLTQLLQISNSIPEEEFDKLPSNASSMSQSDNMDEPYDDLLASDFKEPGVGSWVRCFICKNRAVTMIDGKPFCKDCGGINV